jgi:hypothetical protein
MRPHTLTAYTIGVALSILGNPSCAQFSTPVDLVVQEAYAGVLADVDGDGLLDVVGTGPEGTAWYRNLAGGSFAPPSEISTEDVDQAWNSPAAGDVDGNGSIDILVSLANGELVVYFNFGGTFSGSGTVVGSYLDENLNPNDTKPQALHLVDINNDGDLDVLAEFNWSQGVWCFDDLGVTFGPRRTLFPYAAGTNKVIVVDLNGDGFKDVAYSVDNLATDRVSRRLNDGDGTFGPELMLSDVENTPRYLNQGDMNNDGILDLVYYAAVTNQVMIVVGHGDGTFGAPQGLVTGLGSITQMTVDDISNDGILDIVVSQSYGAPVRFALGQGNLAFGPPDTISTTEPYEVVQCLLTADLDGDEYSDLICRSVSASAFSSSFYRNPGGSGDMWQQTIISSSLDPIAETVGADLDMDGDIDLVTIQPGDWGALAMHENNGGWFERRRIILTGLQDPKQVAMGDIDGDGLIDLVVATEGDGHHKWSRNQGDGTWSIPVPLGFNSTVGVFRVGDMDNDGDADVLVRANGLMRYYRSYGSGALVYEGNLGIAQTTYRLLDVNDDGLLDAVVDNGSAEFTWFQNDGDLSFEAMTQSYPSNAWGACRADIDNDGMKDLLMHADLCYWSRNLGGGILDNPQPLMALSPGAGLLMGADVDADGLEDLVAGYTSGLSWHRNLGGSQMDTIGNIIASGGAHHLLSGGSEWSRESLYQADLDGNGRPDWAWTYRPEGADVDAERIIYVLNAPDIALSAAIVGEPGGYAAPNPLVDVTRVVLAQWDGGTVYGTLFDATGRSMREVVSSGKEMFIERKELPTGMYTLSLRDSDHVLGHVRLVVQ